LLKVSADGVFVYGRNKPKVGTRFSSALSKISGSTTPVPTEIPTSMGMEDSGTGGPQAPSSPSCHGGSSGGGLLGLGLRNASALSCVHPANVILSHPIYSPGNADA
uniref:AT-hook motif nuclear-localized protein n=1 Tax=Hydatigena taeniaeformis TaxID=6205 RepID=A0A0R3WSG9_HYDTA